MKTVAEIINANYVLVPLMKGTDMGYMITDRGDMNDYEWRVWRRATEIRTVKQLLTKAVAGRRNVTYVVFNYSDVVFPAGFEDRCIGIGGDMAEAFQELL